MTPPRQADIEVNIGAVTDAFDAWIASLRVVVSQLGFALDTYLASRPPPREPERPS